MYSNSYLQARFEIIGHKTKLTHRAFSAPLKITKTFQELDNPALILYIMDASPGMMDGDCYQIELDILANSHAIVTNQASTKIHPSSLKGAHLVQTINIAANATLEYFPEPTILYTDSVFNSRTTIELEKSATLCMAEILTCGRVERNEKFVYKRYSSQTNIKYAGKIIAYEHSQFIPSLHTREHIGIYESFTHQATMWIISANITSHFFETIQDLLMSYNKERLLVGTSRFEPYAITVRVMGFTVWEIQEILHEVWAKCRIMLLNLPPLSFRK